jgi:hypothetical protein
MCGAENRTAMGRRTAEKNFASSASIVETGLSKQGESSSGMRDDAARGPRHPTPTSGMALENRGKRGQNEFRLPKPEPYGCGRGSAATI